MIAAGTKKWDLDNFLGDSAGERLISPADIVVHSLYKDDYLFTDEEIRAEQSTLRNIGITQRLVVEQTADGYSLIGPLLPYLALVRSDAEQLPCIVRSGDLPQIQQILSIRLNADYSRLSPLVYSRLITRLGRLFPVIKTISGMNLGIKRDWIAEILGISSSAVLRYSYITKVPGPLQLRCNNPNFPYVCFKDALSFSDVQFRELLDELIHYELHNRYTAVSRSQLTAIIHDIAGRSADDASIANPVADSVSAAVPDTTTNVSPEAPFVSPPLPGVYEPMVMNFYRNLHAQFEDRYDDDIEGGTSSDLFRIIRKNGYVIPDETLQEAAYLLYCLSQSRLTGGQKLQNYACLRSIMDSVEILYDHLVS